MTFARLLSFPSLVSSYDMASLLQTKILKAHDSECDARQCSSSLSSDGWTILQDQIFVTGEHEETKQVFEKPVDVNVVIETCKAKCLQNPSCHAFRIRHNKHNEVCSFHQCTKPTESQREDKSRRDTYILEKACEVPEPSCTWVEYEGTRPWKHWSTRIKCLMGEHGCAEEYGQLRGRYSLALEGSVANASKKCKEMCAAKEGCIAARMNTRHKDMICALHRARDDGPVLVLEPQKKNRPRTTYFKNCSGVLPLVLDELPPKNATLESLVGADADDLPKFYQCGYTSYQGFKFGDDKDIPKNRINCDPANDSGFKCGGTRNELYNIEKESDWHATCKTLCQKNFECGAFRLNTNMGLCSLHNWKVSEESLVRENNEDSRIAWISDCGCWKEHQEHKIFQGWQRRLKCQLDDEDYGCTPRGRYNFSSDDLSVASERCKAICRKKENCTHAMLNTRLRICDLISSTDDELILIPQKFNRPRTTWAKCEAHTTVFDAAPVATEVEDEFDIIDEPHVDVFN